MIFVSRGKSSIALGALLVAAPACAQPGADPATAVPLDRAALAALTALAELPGGGLGFHPLAGSDAAPSTMTTSVGNDPMAGVRDDHVEVLLQSGQHTMSLDRVAGGSTSTIVQTATVDLPRQVPGGPETLGVVFQSAAYDLARGSQAATNVAFSLAFAQGGNFTPSER